MKNYKSFAMGAGGLFVLILAVYAAHKLSHRRVPLASRLVPRLTIGRAS